MQIVLRLLCLASITAGGIKTKSLENIKREVLQVSRGYIEAASDHTLTRPRKAYGYNFLPLLLSFSSTPLSILLPNPLPASTSPSVIASKYPFSSLRKSLRLLIDDNPEALDELENDISYVYSGYAPISARLVQCVAQKGGVLSNPAEREKSGNEDGDGKGKAKAKSHGTGKVQAHPIVGWKGFEDVMAILPGETFDIVQKRTKGVDSAAPSLASLRENYHFIPEKHLSRHLLVQPHEKSTTTIVFFLGGCTYTEIAALRWMGRQNRGKLRLIFYSNSCSVLVRT